MSPQSFQRNLARYRLLRKFLKRFRLKSTIAFADTASIRRTKCHGLQKVGQGTVLRNCKIAGSVDVGSNCSLTGASIAGKVIIGDFTTLSGPNIAIFSLLNKITIGSFCSIGQGVLFQEYGHPTNRCSTFYIRKNLFAKSESGNTGQSGTSNRDAVSKGEISIGNDVWIGAQTVVLGGVSIGDGVIVGANTTVTRDIPDFAIFAGAPGKVIGYRFDAYLRRRLKSIRWWDWPVERLMRNQALFQGELTIEKLQAADDEK